MALLIYTRACTNGERMIINTFDFLYRLVYWGKHFPYLFHTKRNYYNYHCETSVVIRGYCFQRNLMVRSQAHTADGIILVFLFWRVLAWAILRKILTNSLHDQEVHVSYQSVIAHRPRVMSVILQYGSYWAYSKMEM